MKCVAADIIQSKPVLPKPVLRTPCPAPFVCLLYLTHLIPLISSLVETARTKLGVSDQGDIQNVQVRGSSRTGLESTGTLSNNYLCQKNK